MTIWVVILAAGVLTYTTRLSFILLFEKLNLPDWVKRALRFVPPTVMSAIILPELLMDNGVLRLLPVNPRLVAGAIAVLIAWRSRNVLLTILSGMITLWLLQSLL
jgi:branched-subunit amino acid transport protein